MKKILNIPRSLLWGIFILISTLIPGTVIPDVPDFMSLFQPDKIVHLILFGTFVYLLIRDFRNKSTGFLKINAAAIAIFMSVFMGAATEIIQEFIPKRSGNIYDFTADVVGALLGWAAAHFFLSRKYS